LTHLESSLTNTIAVLLSHEVCTVMIRTHKCGLDRTNEKSSRPYLFKSSQGFKQQELIKYHCCLLKSVAALSTDNGQLRTERSHTSAEGNSFPCLKPNFHYFGISRENVRKSHSGNSEMQDKNLPARCSRRSDCTHKLALSHARPATGPLTGPLPRRVAALRSE
jgi:hypothetical protein